MGGVYAAAGISGAHLNAGHRGPRRAPRCSSPASWSRNNARRLTPILVGLLVVAIGVAFG
jgi:glycerol uptake facilitator-like aquaporin